MTRFAARIGNERKKLIAVEAHTSDMAIVAYLSALRAGHAVAMLPPGAREVLADFEARFSPDLVFRRDGERWRLTQTGGGSAHCSLHDDLALVLMTSGSSGKPRAVRLSAANLTANANSIAEYLTLQPGDCACCILPLHYSYGLSVLNSHMKAGATVCLPGVSVRDPAFLSVLEEAGCTNFAGVPYSYELLEKAGFRKRRFANLRLMTVAGGRMCPDLVRKYNRHMGANGGEFFAMYGQTEATARIAYMPPDRLEGNEDRIGVAIPDGALLLLDGGGRPIATSGAEGQLVYTGPNVMMGYGETRQDLGRGHELSSLKTGDLAMRDENGLYRITGRISRFSKIAGIRTGHDFLEAALAAKGVKAAVVGDDRVIQVFFRGDFDSDHVCRLLVEASGLTATHFRVCRMRELPRLSSGKVDYAALSQNVEADTPGETIRSVEEAFAQVFYPRRVTGRDSFITLGGDSLRFVQLSLELDRLMAAVPEGWENMPVSTLSAGVGKTPARKPMMRSVGIDILLRALAILLVVVHHETLWPIPGGSSVMMLLVGYSLARFQSQALFAGRWDALVHPLLQVLVPYFAVVAAYSLAWGEIPWASVTLTGNFGYADPVRHTMIPYLYWFVEAYVQTIAVVAAPFFLPRFRRWARTYPFEAGLAFLTFGVLARYAVPPLIDIGNRQIFTLPWVFHGAMFGWCAAFADTALKRAILLSIAAIVIGYLGVVESVWIGTAIKYTTLFTALAALLFAPRIALPKGLAALVLTISAASFPIYLFHRLVPEVLMLPIVGHLPPAFGQAMSIAGGIAIGLLMRSVQQGSLRFLSVRSKNFTSLQEDRSSYGGKLKFQR